VLFVFLSGENQSGKNQSEDFWRFFMSSFLKEYGDCLGPLNFPMKDQEAKELEHKLETGEYSPIKICKSDAMEGFFPGERADISIISDSTKDKDGEKLNPKGFNWRTFDRNPIVTFGHNYQIPPIGKSLWHKLIQGSVWKAKTQYIRRPENHPEQKEWFPDSIYHMVKEGALPGKSVGGIVKWREPTAEERKDNVSRVGEEIDVFEYSVVPVPSNNNTVVELVSKGVITLDAAAMQSYYPEIYEIIKDISSPNDPIIINSFTTKEQHLKIKRNTLQKGLQRELNKIPNIADKVLRRMLGKVE
jgi:hypothetical protein